MTNILKIVFVIIGSIIGAGFISGQEIYTFFLKFGNIGIACIILMGIILGIVIYKTCFIIMKNKNKNYGEFLDSILQSKYPRIRIFINSLINVFLLISFFIMCAAFCAYFKQEYNISVYLSGLIISIICYMIFVKNIKAIIKVNQILMPIIIILIFFLVIKINIQQVSIKNAENSILAILNCMIYVSYNTIILIPILIKLKSYMKDIKSILVSSIVCSIIIISMALIILCIISQIKEIKLIEIPLLYVTNSYGEVYKYIYSFVLIVAIITSAISAGYGFLENITKDKQRYLIFAFFICVFSIFISNFGFSNLVNILYPLFGILGLIQIFFILKY